MTAKYHVLGKRMKLLLALAALLVSSSAFAVSFDCAKASTFAEKTTCSDSLLRKLDDALSSNYKAMLGADFGGSVTDLRNEQREWIASRNKCTTQECLVAAYKKRIDETCDYGVVSGVHPECVHADEMVTSQITDHNGIQSNPANAQAAATPTTSITPVPKAPTVIRIEDAAPGEVDVPDTVDPAQVEVQGFHLHMTGKEVIERMEAKYNLKPTVVYGNENATPFYPDDNQLLSYASVSTPTFKLKISFTPIYPAEPNRPEVATLIEYYPNLTTTADKAAFKQQVIAKYGEPGAGSGFSKEIVNWCRRGVKAASYYECDAHLPKMTLDTLRIVSLVISDNGGVYRRQKKQWESEKKALLPPL